MIWLTIWPTAKRMLCKSVQIQKISSLTLGVLRVTVAACRDGYFLHISPFPQGFDTICSEKVNSNGLDTSSASTFCEHCILLALKVFWWFCKTRTIWLENVKVAKCDALPLHEEWEAHKNAAVKALAFKDVCEGWSRHIQPRKFAFENWWHRCFG